LAKRLFDTQNLSTPHLDLLKVLSTKIKRVQNRLKRYFTREANRFYRLNNICIEVVGKVLYTNSAKARLRTVDSDITPAAAYIVRYDAYTAPLFRYMYSTDI
jgi:hypothetical protein